MIDGVELEGLEWESVKDKNGNIVNYNWVGFDKKGNPKPGSVGEAQVNFVEHGLESFEYYGVGSDNKPINYTGLRAPWLSTARNEIGVTEIPGSKHNPRIMEYHNSTLFPPTNDDNETGPWCASFCNWVLEEQGYESGQSSWSIYWGDNYRKNGMTKSKTPVYGSVAIFKWTDSKGHAGFVVGTDGKGGIYVLGGNQGDEVNVRHYTKEKVLKTMGFFLPKSYEASSYDKKGLGMDKLYYPDSQFLKNGEKDR